MNLADTWQPPVNAAFLSLAINLQNLAEGSLLDTMWVHKINLVPICTLGLRSLQIHQSLSYKAFSLVSGTPTADYIKHFTVTQHNDNQQNAKRSLLNRMTLRMTVQINDFQIQINTNQNGNMKKDTMQNKNQQNGIQHNDIQKNGIHQNNSSSE